MDCNEEATAAAFIIATFTENIKRKKGGRERNGLNLGLKGEIPMDFILNDFVTYVWRKKKLRKLS